MGLGLLVGQKKQFEDMTMDSKKLWWALSTVLIFSKVNDCENNQQIIHNENNCYTQYCDITVSQSKTVFQTSYLTTASGKYTLDYTITNVNPSNILLNKSPTQIYKIYQST